MARRVLIHMGHVQPREPGFESGTGTAGEIPVVEAIGKELYRLLRADGRIKPTLCPGDIPDGWHGEVVLALHCDGSSNPKANGYCFGWPVRESGPKTRRLIRALDDAYRAIPDAPSHHRDNYTSNMTLYYGWKRTRADAKVLIEHGFLTNPGERAWINKNVKRIAGAWYGALLRYFDLPALVKKPVPGEPHNGWLRRLFGRVGMPWIPYPEGRMSVA
jgi:N-acetylmuramoyl-L-alanine amidase